MTAGIAMRTGPRSAIVATDRSLFGENGEKWNLPPTQGKAFRKNVLSSHGVKVGEAIVSHAGDWAFGQELERIGLARVQGKDPTLWKPGHDWMHANIQKWRSALKEIDAFDEDGFLRNNGEILVAVLSRNEKSELKIYSVGNKLEFLEHMEFGTIGCATDTLNSAVAVLLEEEEAEPLSIIGKAFDIARRFYAHVGAEVQVELLEG